MTSKSAIKILEIHSFASSACRIYPCKGATWAVTIFLIQDDNLTAEVPLRRSILQSTLRQKYRSTGRHNPQRDGGPEKGLYRLHPIALGGSADRGGIGDRSAPAGRWHGAIWRADGGRFFGSLFFCVHPLGLNKLRSNTRICCDKQSLLAVPIFVGDETAHGILPVDPTALSWTFRWSPHHRSNRPYEPPHNLVRPTVGNSGILPRLPDRIPTRSLLALPG